MRTTEFWHNLAEVSRKFYSHVVMFAVDGLADTHSIYRVRTKFDKIIENIKAFTNNAGRARVIMTVSRTQQTSNKTSSRTSRTNRLY